MIFMKHSSCFCFRLLTLMLFFTYAYPVESQSLVAIPNVNNYICGYFGVEDDMPFIFQNKIVIRLRQVSSSNFVLAFYDGSNYTIINNPDGGSGYQGHPIVYKNNLYIKYEDVNRQNRLAKLNGNTLTLIDNLNMGNHYEGQPIIYKDTLYFKYKTNQLKIGKYSGTTLSVVHDALTIGYSKMVVYKDKLYFEDGSTRQVMQSDGTNATILNQYPGPAVVGVVDAFAILQDTLFVKGHSNLVRTDGNTCTTIPKTNLMQSFHPYPFGHEPFIYNNGLFWACGTAMGYQWVQYKNGQLTLISNPTTGVGVEHQFGNTAIFNDKLYFRYVDDQNKYRLAQLDGTTITLIPSALGSPAAFGGANNYPTVFHNGLYVLGVAPFPMTLGKFDGQQITGIQNSQQLIVMPGSPIVFNNNLYVKTANFLARLEEDIVSNQAIQPNYFALFPNPVNDYLVLDYNGYEPGTLKIFNLLGQEMLSQRLQERQNQINVADFPKGTYLTHIIIDKKVFYQKITKQ